MRLKETIPALILTASLTTIGCASSSGPGAGAQAVEASREVVVGGVEVGLESADAMEPFDVPIRYNPARCDCPDFEVRVRGRWVRAYVEGGEEAMSALDDFSARADEDPQARMVLRGRLTEDTRRSSRDVVYRIFEVE